MTDQLIRPIQPTNQSNQPTNQSDQSIEIRLQQVRRAGGAAAEENKALRTIFLNGNRNTTDSGGPGGRGKGGGNIGGGGGGGGGGGQGGGDGEGKGEGEGESGENGNEGDDDAFGIKVTGRKREKIVRKVDKAIRKGKVRVSSVVSCRVVPKMPPPPPAREKNASACKMSAF